jgi:serine phosphatase RsbU (regulator of sigma subunit)/anti-sigma regulatory factor (Ser/Thr protein kinase)
VEDFPGLADVVRERDVVFVPDVLEEATGEGLDLVRELGIRSSLRTPFVLAGRTELVLAISWQVVVSEPDPSTIAVVQRFADQAILALEEVERRRAEREAARRAGETHRLQEITAALALASSPLDVSHICLEHALRSVGADAGFVVLADPGGTSVELVSSSGLDDDELELWQSFGLDADVPFARAMAGGEAIWAVGPEELARFTAVESHAAASATIPLGTPAGMHGALHLVFREPTEVDHAQRVWLQAAVSQCAQALERSRLFEREQVLRGRAERLQAMTGELSNALTRADVAEVAVDELGEALEADRAVLYVVDADREALRALAWRGVESDAAASLEVPLQSSSPASRAVARRRTEVAASEAELVRSLPELGAREPWLVGSASGLFVPLVVGRRSSGVVGLVWDEPRTVPGDELRFAESLAGQAAQALDRASHFESEQTIAETLQRSVLPVALPRVEGVQLAARYLPGTAELDVGGDWFDAVQLRDGRLALVVGDVVGKGVYAAASMGQLRNALRAFSIDRLKPSSVLGRLNRLADEALETTFATLVYVAVDPETRVVRYATAGHPPPVAVYPDDRVELLEDGRGLPLGTGMKTKYKQAVVELPVGALLLLYSDGLVERRGQSIDEGLEELLAVVREAPREPERLLDHVLDAMVGTAERGDDIALLAARVLGVAPKPLELGISSRTGSLDVVRDALRVWLDSAGVKRTDAEDIILATWEACANAIEHALEPAAELVHVTASYEDSTVRVTIADSGRWAPFADRPGRGLGLRLMEALMTDVRVDSKDGGTRVTVEKRLDGAELTGPRRAR